MEKMNSWAVDIENLFFSYPGNEEPALQDITLKIPAGERFGIFGPNGAGKTTLINLITGILSYKRGSIKILGLERKEHENEVKKLFGFVPQDFSMYMELSPVENLEFFGTWAGMNKKLIKERTKELLEIFGLKEVRNKAVGKFSGGMKRRINLAIGVIHQPEVLFLDEPTVGVDIHSRNAIIDHLKLLNQKGTTLIYTSHQLQEAEDLCETIALIDEGKILLKDKLDKLITEYQSEGLEKLFLNLTGKAFRD